MLDSIYHIMLKNTDYNIKSHICNNENDIDH